MLVVLPPIFVVDTKVIYSYNFVVPLNAPTHFIFSNSTVETSDKGVKHVQS